jgi:hypothetical protein
MKAFAACTSRWAVPVGIKTAGRFSQERRSMTKTLDVIHETVRNSKHPFRQVNAMPDKPKKNRYERRKVREYLRLSEWGSEES